jgi:hypothetical protein
LYEAGQSGWASLKFGKINTQGLYSGTIPLRDVVELGFKKMKLDKSLVKLAIAP